eukprot:141469-Chlamydomonas_euryale.AAC.1
MEGTMSGCRFKRGKALLKPKRQRVSLGARPPVGSHAPLLRQTKESSRLGVPAAGFAPGCGQRGSAPRWEPG